MVAGRLPKLIGLVMLSNHVLDVVTNTQVGSISCKVESEKTDMHIVVPVMFGTLAVVPVG